jgi:hypothetical protein
MAARGAEFTDEPEEVAVAASAPRPSLMQRLIPPAPPLRGKGDPLAGFSYEGPLRSVVIALYLLRRNPIAWVAPGLVYVLGLEVGIWGNADSTVFLVVQILQYGALAAAGWFGWQRPWLFGLAAALLGIAGSTVVLTFLAANAGPGGFRPLTYFASEAVFYAALGLVAGWYGGYLRRRLADQRPPQATARARRR